MLVQEIAEKHNHHLSSKVHASCDQLPEGNVSAHVILHDECLKLKRLGVERRTPQV